jgi:hypothetical protein
LRLFLAQLRRNNHGDRPADGLRGGISESALGSAVPTVDNPVQILGNNGVVGGLHNGGKAGTRLLGLRGFGNVHVDADQFFRLAVLVKIDFPTGAHSSDGPVAALDAEFAVELSGS